MLPTHPRRWTALRSSPRVVLALVTCTLFIDMLLYDMVVAFLPQHLRSWGVSQSEIGLLFATYAFGVLLATPVMGFLADRLGWRVPVLWGICGLLGSMCVYSLAPSHVWLFGARFLQGMSGAALWTAGWAGLAEVYPAESRGRAMGTAMAGMSLGTLLGPPLGGVLFEWGDYRLPFVVGTCLTMLLGMGFALLHSGGTPAERPAQPPPVGRLLRDRTLLATLGVVMLGSSLLSMLEPTLPLHLETHLKCSPVTVGLLFGLATLAYGICAPLAGVLSDRWGRNRIMTAGLVATVVTFPLIALPTARLPEALALIGLGLACAFLLSPTLPELADAADRQGHGAYGTVYALFNTAYAVGMLAGPVLGGALAGRLGFPLGLAIVSVACAFFLPVLLRTHQRRGLGLRPPTPGADSPDETLRQAG